MNNFLSGMCRYVVPGDLTVGQFINVVRKRIQPPPERAIVVFVQNNQPAATMADIYAENRDNEDGLLYLTYRRVSDCCLAALLRQTIHGAHAYSFILPFNNIRLSRPYVVRTTCSRIIYGGILFTF
ncbi:uncharacterized protein LOC132266808 [Cornus florida]|uniref:uncharacterized protein LOC132266808 n=1 Tax=Cornus florida TaxID=4283 RepID=UPI00289C9267|nr:uncharacterized protein LOC132266808 [Cornus florida]